MLNVWMHLIVAWWPSLACNNGNINEFPLRTGIVKSVSPRFLWEDVSSRETSVMLLTPRDLGCSHARTILWGRSTHMTSGQKHIWYLCIADAHQPPPLFTQYGAVFRVHYSALHCVTCGYFGLEECRDHKWETLACQGSVEGQWWQKADVPTYNWKNADAFWPSPSIK